MRLSSQHRANPETGHQCRSLSSAGTRPKLRDPPGHRHPMTWCLARCSYQSQTTGLAYTNCNAYRGVTDLKCLNMFMSNTSEGAASNRSPCTRAPLPPVNAQRSQAPAPMCAPRAGPIQALWERGVGQLLLISLGSGGVSGDVAGACPLF